MTQTCEREDGRPIDSGVDPDGSRDGGLVLDAPAGCFGIGVVVICPDVLPSQPITLSAEIDTDTSASCISYTGTSPGTFCVVAGTSVSAAGTVSATGTRPLVIVATESTIQIESLDVSSQRMGDRRGAGSNSTACIAGEAPLSDEGGAGGSFGGSGGAGGGASSTQGPSPGAIATIAELRGGCPGRDAIGTSAGEGGRGGGAVYLIAKTEIIVAGTINASAMSGSGGDNGTAGGGGGSGGMIGFDAPSISIAPSAEVFANGAGGGGGSIDSLSGAQGAHPSAPLVKASGGGGSQLAGDGGDGSAAGALAGEPGEKASTATAGGGGGGGGAGVIRVFPFRVLSGAISPPPT